MDDSSCREWGRGKYMRVSVDSEMIIHPWTKSFPSYLYVYDTVTLGLLGI